jgi:hypothetical protein
MLFADSALQRFDLASACDGEGGLLGHVQTLGVSLLHPSVQQLAAAEADFADSAAKGPKALARELRKRHRADPHAEHGVPPFKCARLQRTTNDCLGPQRARA